jgi:hypothetical protein
MPPSGTPFFRKARPALLAAFIAACTTTGTDNSPTGPSDNPPAQATRISFWLDGNVSGNVTVTLDGANVGTLAGYFSSQPNCGQAGTLTLNTTAGPHTVSATGGGVTWNATPVTVSAGQCTSFRFIVPVAPPQGPQTFTEPATLFMASQGGALQTQCAYRTEAFTVSTTRTYVFRFAARYNAQAAIITPDQLSRFQACQSFSGFGLFDGTFGVHSVTLAPGSYYVAIRNMQASSNAFGYELDYTIASSLINPENGWQFTFNDIYVSSARIVTKGSRFVQPITIQAGVRYFLDGLNSGAVECFIIPASATSNFLAGQSFLQYDAYHETTGGCPGQYEIRLPPGDYALALRNNSAVTDETVVMTLERWRIGQ